MSLSIFSIDKVSASQFLNTINLMLSTDFYEIEI